MPEKEKKDGSKTCYYEVLGVDRKCDPDEIKKSYRKLALKMHPDKAHLNNLSTEEATTKFQEIQEAYSVLSDPQERSWYDGHREQILRGGDGPGEDPFKTRINLYKYFSSSCYKGFTDKDDGFYKVYAELFAAIDEEETSWEDAEDEEHVPMPPFGMSTSNYTVVSKFYKHWLDFVSRKAFGHADKWNPATAPNRQVRRAMEQENKDERKAAKKEFNSEVRQLVAFVQKRDPRWAEYQRQLRQQAIEKEEKARAEKEEKKARARRAAEEARLEEEKRWAEYEAEREARIARGEAVTDDESENDSVEFRCEACRKSFKSEKAFDQHTKSKKHLQIVAKLRSQLAEDLNEEVAGENEGKEEDEEAREKNKKQKGQKGKKDKERRRKAEEEDEEEEEEGGEDEQQAKPSKGATASSTFRPPSRVPEASKGAKTGVGKSDTARKQSSDNDDAADESVDEDDFVACFASRQQASSRSVKKDVKPENEEEDDDEDSSGDEAAAMPSFASNKQKKKNRQKAALLEKQRHAQDVDDGDGSESEGGDGKEQTTKAATSKKALRREQEREKQKAIAAQKKAASAAVQDLVEGVRKAQREEKKEVAEGKAASTVEENVEPESIFETVGKCSNQQASAAAKKKGKKKTEDDEAKNPICGVCGEEFESRTKLFAHIKSTGHAVLKTIPEPAQGKKKKK